jgi:Tol biopolymer transport system component
MKLLGLLAIVIAILGVILAVHLTGATGPSSQPPAQQQSSSTSPVATSNAQINQTAQPRIAFVSNRSGHPEIYTINLDGSNQKQLTSGNTSDALYEKLVWSPDARKIAFVSKSKEVSDYYHVPHGIYVIDADGGNLTHLADDINYPSWSKDGTKLGVLRKYWVLNTDGISWRESTGNDQVIAFDPGISPDRSKVALIRWDSDFIPYIRGKIHETNVNPINDTAITGTFYFDEVSGIAWAPDSWRIAFVSMEGSYPSENKHAAIYIVNADGSGQQRITDGTRRDSQPAWSYDGNKIVFVSNRDDNSQIYTMNSDGSSQIRLTNDSYEDTSPAWCPK